MFFFLVSFFKSAPNWNDLFYTTVPIIIAYYSLRKQWIRKIVYCTLTFNIIVFILVTLIITNKVPRYNTSAIAINSVEKNLVAELLPLTKKYQYIFSNNYRLSSLLAFYLPEHPSIYSFPNMGNEYARWSEPEYLAITTQKMPLFLFLSDNSQLPSISGYRCMQKYRSHSKLPNAVIIGKGQWLIYAYSCRLSAKHS